MSEPSPALSPTLSLTSTSAYCRRVLLLFSKSASLHMPTSRRMDFIRSAASDTATSCALRMPVHIRGAETSSRATRAIDSFFLSCSSHATCTMAATCFLAAAPSRFRCALKMSKGPSCSYSLSFQGAPCGVSFATAARKLSRLSSASPSTRAEKPVWGISPSSGTMTDRSPENLRSASSRASRTKPSCASCSSGQTSLSSFSLASWLTVAS
mmetsp:Transcript_47841/g.116489  ORF Transcript_47841/g.116489 Transcript_47841/m.116489 type:complete len:211 (-) Transcript_47841:1245-1877(-)